MADELNEIQRHKQRLSKESAKAKKEKKVVEEYFQVSGNKIQKVTRINNGQGVVNKHTTFIDFVEKEEKVNERKTGRRVHTPVYKKLLKEGRLSR